MNTADISHKVGLLPEQLQHEVNDFVDFLLSRSNPEPKKPGPVFGSARGMITLSEDFDEPLDDFKEYMA